MTGIYGMAVKDLREFLDSFNDNDDVYIEGSSLGGKSTKDDRELWVEINSVADDEDDEEDEGDDGD